jgi:NADH-quinone oxidoreductase subunit E
LPEKINKNQEDAMSVTQADEPVDLAPAMRIVNDMSPLANGDIIPLLQRLQEAYGYLPPEVVLTVCEETGLTASRVFGVATFYSQFTMEPRGKHMVRCCKGTACHVRGGNRVLGAIEKILGIGDGETTRDMRFSQETVACLGACALAPVMVMDKTYYGKMTARRTELLLKELMKEES